MPFSFGGKGEGFKKNKDSWDQIFQFLHANCGENLGVNFTHRLHEEEGNVASEHGNDRLDWCRADHLSVWDAGITRHTERMSWKFAPVS